MIVVTIIGILAVVAGPAYNRYQQRAKTAEAVSNVKAIAEGALTYYSNEQINRIGVAVPRQFPTSIGPTPQDTACQNGAPFKFDPQNFLNEQGFGAEGWQKLQFGVSKPFIYHYELESNGVGADARFTARAEGDLDCDGALSLFERVGYINQQQVVLGDLFYQNDLE